MKSRLGNTPLQDSGMTLAVLFLLISSLGAAPAARARSTQTSEPPASQSAQESQAKPETQTQETQPSVQTPSTKTSAGTKSGVKRHTHRKKTTAAPCVMSSASPAPAKSTPENTAADPAVPKSSQTATTPPAKDCPPPKIIVRHGGTKEPSIQLAGGPNADQSAEKRGAINQLLEVTDQNLKKTSAMQLNSTQQGTVTQTRQFIDQSKAAMADGDFERARTLAWKAQLLSEDLVKPEK